MQAIISIVLLLFLSGGFVMLITLFDFQLLEKPPHTLADAAEQGEVVWPENLSHAVFDVLLVSLFLHLVDYALFTLAPLE